MSLFAVYVECIESIYIYIKNVYTLPLNTVFSYIYFPGNLQVYHLLNDKKKNVTKIHVAHHGLSLKTPSFRPPEPSVSPPGRWWFQLSFVVVGISGCFLKWWYPNFTPQVMIISSRKTHGFVEETHHFRKPPSAGGVVELFRFSDCSGK